MGTSGPEELHTTIFPLHGDFAPDKQPTSLTAGKRPSSSDSDSDDLDVRIHTFSLCQPPPGAPISYGEELYLHRS